MPPSPPVARSDRCTGCRSRSRTPSTRPASSPPGDRGLARSGAHGGRAGRRRLRKAGGILVANQHPSSRGPTRPTTTSTADLEPLMTLPVRPAAAVAARRPSSPPARRRSTSAATPATASANRHTCAGSRASSRRPVESRGPGIPRTSAVSSRPSRGSDRSPAGSRTWSSSCRSSAGPTVSTLRVPRATRRCECGPRRRSPRRRLYRQRRPRRRRVPPRPLQRSDRALVDDGAVVDGVGHRTRRGRRV